MRALILVAATALTLAACRNNDQHDNNMNVDENLTAENIVSNDVTAIDAVTSDAANMAADVNYEDMSDNSVANVAVNRLDTTAPKSKAKAAPSKEETPPATSANASANASGNGAE